MNQDRDSSKHLATGSLQSRSSAGSLRRGPSATARLAGAVASVAVTFALLQSVSTGFLSAPAVQLAKANAHAGVIVASNR